MTHKIIFIASDFPPLAGTNTQRVQSFVRHLPKFDWEAIVITRSIEDLTLVDSSQLKRLTGDFTVHRVPDPDIFSRLKRRRGGCAKDINSKEPQSAPEGNSVGSVKKESRSTFHPGLRLASEIVMTLCRYFLYLPDALTPWANACVKRGLALCRERNIDVVIASAPSYSCLVAGLALARKSRLPFVADFRDLWVERPYRQVISRWHDLWDRHLERKVVNGAQRIIVASPSWIAHFDSHYGKAIADKCVVITNGYDESLIPEDAPQLAYAEGVTTFLNTGAMYGSESPAPFLIALGKVLRRQPELRKRVGIRLIGYAGNDETLLRQLIDHWKLNNLVEMTGPKSHAICLGEQRKADVLLLFSGPEHRDTIRGKSFEYMAIGTPILALIPSHGIQAELLRKSGTATIIEHGDVDATERAIEEILTRHQPLRHTPNWEFIRGFERVALTKKLADTLNSLVTN